MQKSLNTLLGCLFVAALFFTACEREVLTSEQEAQPINHVQLTQAEQLYEQLLAIEAQTGKSLEITLGDITKALEVNGTDVVLKNDDCCYGQNELDLLIECFGAQAPLGDCEDIDFNGDGFVNTSDLLILLANWCGTVEAIATTPANIDLYEGSLEGRIYNVSTINGEVWTDPDVFDALRWYFDGVPVSNNVYGLQLETPGWPTYDVEIDCTHGYHEVELVFIIDCQVYSTSTCVFIRSNSGVPTCNDDYCNP